MFNIYCKNYVDKDYVGFNNQENYSWLDTTVSNFNKFMLTV